MDELLGHRAVETFHASPFEQSVEPSVHFRERLNSAADGKAFLL